MSPRSSTTTGVVSKRADRVTERVWFTVTTLRQSLRAGCGPVVTGGGPRRGIAETDRQLHEGEVEPAAELDADLRQHTDRPEAETLVQRDRPGVACFDGRDHDMH